MEGASNYTSFRLSHGTPRHLHATSVVRFIGPIPHSWITTYKKRWFHKPRTNYHRKDLPFDRPDNRGQDGQDLSACARWQAESHGAQISRSNTIQAESSNNVITPQQIPVIVEEQEDSSVEGDQSPVEHYILQRVEDASCNQNGMPKVSEPLADVLAASKTSERFQEPSSSVTSSGFLRPKMSMLDLASGRSTRESSSVSQTSFETAPETFEEYGSLHDTGLTEHDNIDREVQKDQEEEASDTSTIRGIRTLPAASIELPTQDTLSSADANLCLPQQVNQSEPSSMSNQRPESSDADSATSLLKHKVTAAGSLRGKSGQPAASNLVRFTSESAAQVKQNCHRRQTTICAEGEALDRDRSLKITRQNQGYFNQSLLRNPFRKPKHNGELLRAERMLLRIEYAPNGVVPDNYSDALAMRIDRRVDMHWREFVVAARNDDAGRVVLSFHRNRSIPVITKSVAKIKAATKIVITTESTKCNFYSSLDKTIVIWQKEKKKTMIYILRPLTSHSSIEWYAFLQTSLGIKPKTTAIISVPTLNVRLRVELKSSIRSRRGSTSQPDDVSQSTDLDLSSLPEEEDNDEASINEDGQLLSNGVAITGDFLVDACWRLLSRDKQWKDVLRDWRNHEKLGLCWRRYDRLEWIHGHDARQLVGQWAMAQTHELEFRPKEHYPTEIKLPMGSLLQEPSPIEGFLVRLTSSTGRQARFGKVFYKRLYFASHNNLLFFAHPGNSLPPPPPGFCSDDLGDSEHILETGPLVYDVDPYPLEDGHISWLLPEFSKAEVEAKDHIAVTEAARRVSQLHASDGFIDLTKVSRIRRCQRMTDDVENDIGHAGDGVRFDVSPEDEDGIVLNEHEGAIDEFDDQRVFELVLRSGLVVRLQAFDASTRDAWMSQLGKLVDYWVPKLKDDSQHFRTMKQDNMDALKIDEETESLVGQYANKWEVSQCVSEPRIYNFCSISSCRTIALHGLLYRKPRVHSTFKKYECVVSHGKLLLYNHLHYDAGGTPERHIHHSRRQTIDLHDAYIFSGIVAASDLLSTRDSSDREGPGRHSLPRLYMDGWTSQDEQEALCFVLWCSRKRIAFSGGEKEDAHGNKVSRLGIAGRHLIFMARCRQERDLWVQVISNEIQRSHATGTVKGPRTE